MSGAVPADAGVVASPVVETPDLVSATDAAPPENLARFALIYGQPMTELPTDLYIPPEALQIFLEAFEGPLDLLLYLIRKQNLNILDIPMAKLTKQYLAYVDAMQDRQFELAAEYLLMAAMLIEIKSRMLLPRPPNAEAAESDPRAELVRRLMEYEQIKLAAKAVDALPIVGRDFEVAQVFFERNRAVRLPNIRPADLHAAWAGLVANAKMNTHHLITREALSVRDQMSKLMRLLAHRNHVEFVLLFEVEASVPVLVVTFLAILEMAREQMIEVTQAEGFAPIYVRLAYEPKLLS